MQYQYRIVMRSNKLIYMRLLEKANAGCGGPFFPGVKIIGMPPPALVTNSVFHCNSSTLRSSGPLAVQGSRCGVCLTALVCQFPDAFVAHMQILYT